MEPRVGIFFVVAGALWMESTPVSQGEPYGACITFGGGHPKFWDELIKAGSVPPQPYEASPRGRALLDTVTGQFHIYADRCIARDVGMMSEIKSRLKLPLSTRPERDSHYVCKICAGPEWVELLDA
jgi:hypothetical protein